MPLQAQSTVLRDTPRNTNITEPTYFQPPSHRKVFLRSRRVHAEGMSDVGMEMGGIVLRTLEQAASLAPVPYLKDAASLALGIIDMLKQTSDNVDSFRKLATEAGDIVYSILDTWSAETQRGVTMSNELQRQLKDVVDVLVSIQAFVEKRIHRNRLLRFLSNASDAGKVLDLRSDLRQAVDKFGVQSNMRLRLDVQQLLKQQETIAKTLARRASQDALSGISDTRQHPASGNHRSSDFFQALAYSGGSYTAIGGDYSTTTNNITNNSRNMGNVSSTIIANTGNIGYAHGDPYK